jgi:ATP/maltotriose-dependent transcriptional regulator MalT
MMMRLQLAEIYARLGDPAAAREQADLAAAAASPSGATTFEALFADIARVELALMSGDMATARRSRDDAVERLHRLPTLHPVKSHGLAVILSTAAKLDVDDGDLEQARRHLEEAYQAGINSKDMPIVATVGVAVAVFAHALGRSQETAEILGAAAQVRGADDLTHLDVRRLDGALGGLLAGQYAATYQRGKAMRRHDALARVDPASLSDA